MLLWALASGGCGPGEDAAAEADVAEDSAPADVKKACEVDIDCGLSEHPCRKNICDPVLGCLEKVRPEGSVCQHLDACTEGGVCSKVGKCEGAEPKVCDDKDPCTVDVCQPKTGKCASTAAPDGTGCDDGDKCTAGDACLGGKCEPGKTSTCGCTSNADCASLDSDDKCAGTHYCDKSLDVPACKLNPASVVTCAEKKALCEANTCDPKTGKCAMQPVADGTLCDDGDLCTVNTKCEGGGCKGGESTCKCKADADCGSQDDGNLCNGVMFCNLALGSCALNPATIVNCPSVDDTECLRNICFPKTGKCAMTALEKLKPCAKGEGCKLKPLGPGEKPSLDACDDGNPCTPDDTCKDGKCTAANNTCTCKKDADCVDKDDGNLCNGVMFCNIQTGMCEVNPKTVVNCQSVFDKPCEKNTCMPKTGECKLQAVPDDLPCDADGSVCTPYDTCKSGKCEVGKNVCKCGDSGECEKWEDGDLCNGTLYCDKAKAQCLIDPTTVVGCPSVDDTQCKKNLCAPKTGKCKMTFMVKGFPCEDNKPCTQNDACDNGACLSGVDTCDCHVDVDCAAKEDGDLCNGTLYCDKSALPWKCVVNPATVVKCPIGQDSYCQTNTCKLSTGKCLMVFKHTDEPCDDGDPCTPLTICKVGKCQEPQVGVKKKCDDDNVCTDDGCDPKAGCVNKPNKAPCTDGDACTAGDICESGKCKVGLPLSCDDKNPCTTDVCQQKGGCVVFPNSSGCDDGDPCTLGDACKSSKCVPGKQKDCSDGDICTWDHCENKLGAGKCFHVKDAAKACGDGIACTLDTCDAVLGCKHQPQSAACDDKIGCTKDICNLGGGCEHTPQHDLCKSAGACAVSVCAVDAGCQSSPVPEGTACVDDDPCTTGDKCQGGKCVAGPGKSAACPNTKACAGKVDGAKCDDGDKCTADGDSTCLGGACRAAVKSVMVRTLFGNGSPKTRDGVGTQASIHGPAGVAVDGAGQIFVSSTMTHTIQRVGLDRRVVTVAGSVYSTPGFQDGKGTAARFYKPSGMAFDHKGNLIIADRHNNRVRRMAPDGQVTTVAGSGKKGAGDSANGALATFYEPVAVAVDKQGDIFVADRTNYRIRRIKPSGAVTTFAGGSSGFVDGKGTAARFGAVYDLAFGPKGDLFVADLTNNRLRRISAAGVVSTVAGTGQAGSADGPGAKATFSWPIGVAVDPSGVIYVAENIGRRIRRVMPGGAVTTLAGKGAKGMVDGPGLSALFNTPQLIALDSRGDLIVPDMNNHRVRRVVLRRDGCAGVDACTAPACDVATGVCKAVKVCDDASPCTLDTCSAATGACAYKNAATGTACDDGDPCTQAVQCSGGVCRPHVKVTTLSGAGGELRDGVWAAARYKGPRGLVFDDDGHLFVADAGNHVIRKVTTSGRVHTFAGSPWGGGGYKDGQGTAARFYGPSDLAVDGAGNLYVSDTGNHRIRKITPGGLVTTLAGGAQGYADGKGGGARFNSPHGVAVTAGGIVYVADSANHRLRRIMPDGTTTTLAGKEPGQLDGQGPSARLYLPSGLALDHEGNVLVADVYNNAIRRVTPSGYVTTVSGIGLGGLADGRGPRASMFNRPYDLAVDRSGNIYVADTYNHALRVVFTDGSTATVAGGAAGYADGVGAQGKFSYPSGVAVRPDGAIVVSDRGNNRLRLLTPAVKSCDDANACTLDTCTRFTGCTHAPTASACSDGAPCTKGDKCSAGKCLAGPKVPGCKCAGKTCSDGDSCTTDGCDPDKGCVWDPIEDGTACDDGSPCTQGERCVGGDCSPDPRKWVVETFAGAAAGDRDGRRLPTAGHGSSARMDKPTAINFGPGGALYVAGAANNVVRRVDPDGVMRTLAGRAHSVYSAAKALDGKRFAAAFNQPYWVDVDAAGNAYIAEVAVHRVRKLAPDGTVTTFAGSGKAGFANGKGSVARFNAPQGLAVDPIGNVYVADRNNHRIRKIAPDGEVTTLAGGAAGTLDGVGTQARFSSPWSISLGDDGYLYVTSYGDSAIRRLSLQGVVQTVAGHVYKGFLDGFGVVGAKFARPRGATADAKGRVFVADSDNSKVRMILPWGETVTIAGGLGVAQWAFKDGPGDLARFKLPMSVIIGEQGRIYVVDNGNNRIRRLREVGGSCDDGNPCTIDVCDPKKGCLHTPADPAKACPYGGPCVVPACDVKAGVCTFKTRPDGQLCGDPGDCSRQCSQGVCARVALGWDHAGGIWGWADGEAQKAKFNHPMGLTVDKKGVVYVADRDNHRIRKLAPDGTVSTLAGGSAGYAEGKGGAAKFNQPADVALTAAGDLWVADAKNHRIRKVTPAGVVTTLAGSGSGYVEGVGTLAKFATPLGVVADGKGGVYVADTYNNRIRHVAAGGKTSLVAGSGGSDDVDGEGAAASFYRPVGLALDGKGALIVADSYNNAIRRVELPGGVVTTVLGMGRYWNDKIHLDGEGPLGTALYRPKDVAALPDGSWVVADAYNHVIRRVWFDGRSETLAGLGGGQGHGVGIGRDVRFKSPWSVAVGPDGDIYVADYNNHRIRRLSIKLKQCTDLSGVSRYAAGKSCKSIQSLQKWKNIPAWWVDPGGGDKADSYKTVCDMTTAGGGWTGVDVGVDPKDVQSLLGSKGRMMLKCSAFGTEHLYSPPTDKTWAWANKKQAVPGSWVVNGKAATCGADASFDTLSCGFGFGCSEGAGGGKAKVLPGVKLSNQCANTTTAQTDGPFNICSKNKNYNKYQVFVRSED